MIRLYFILFFILTVISCQHKERETKEIDVTNNTSLKSDDSIVVDTMMVKGSIEKQEQKSTRVPSIKKENKNIDLFHKTWYGIVYTSLKEIPQLDFPDLNKFFNERISYPQELYYDTSSQRRIYVSFQVTKEGISEVKVVKGLKGYLDSSCVGAVRQYPTLDRWKQMENSAKARIIIPFQFKEEGESVRYRDNQIDPNYLKFEDNLITIFGFRPVHHFKD